MSPQVFCAPDTIYQIGVEPFRIDFLTEIDGVDFESAWTSRRSLVFDGVAVNVIGRRELLLNKKASGRPKDVVDAAWLEENQDSEN